MASWWDELLNRASNYASMTSDEANQKLVDEITPRISTPEELEATLAGSPMRSELPRAPLTPDKASIPVLTSKAQEYETFSQQFPELVSSIKSGDYPTDTDAQTLDLASLLIPSKRKTIPSAYSTELSDAQLKAAQQRRDDAVLGANLLTAGNMIGRAIARMPLEGSDAYARSAIPQAEKGVEDILTRRKAADQELQSKAAKMELQKKEASMDPDSEESKAARELYKKSLRLLGIGDIPGFDQFSKYDLESNKSVLELAEKGAARQELSRQALDEKRKKASELSKEQVGAITNFDNSIRGMQELLSAAENKVLKTGQIAGRLPDMFTKDEEVALRAQLGMITDKYRKEITGAGASMAEVNRLATRLPELTDTPKNFISKARKYLDALQKDRSTNLDNWSKLRKDVSQFRSDEDNLLAEIRKRGLKVE